MGDNYLSRSFTAISARISFGNLYREDEALENVQSDSPNPEGNRRSILLQMKSSFNPLNRSRYLQSAQSKKSGGNSVQSTAYAELSLTITDEDLMGSLKDTDIRKTHEVSGENSSPENLSATLADPAGEGDWDDEEDEDGPTPEQELPAVSSGDKFKLLQSMKTGVNPLVNRSRTNSHTGPAGRREGPPRSDSVPEAALDRSRNNSSATSPLQSRVNSECATSLVVNASPRESPRPSNASATGSGNSGSASVERSVYSLHADLSVGSSNVSSIRDSVASQQLLMSVSMTPGLYPLTHAQMINASATSSASGDPLHMESARSMNSGLVHKTPMLAHIEEEVESISSSMHDPPRDSVSVTASESSKAPVPSASQKRSLGASLAVHTSNDSRSSGKSDAPETAPSVGPSALPRVAPVTVSHHDPGLPTVERHLLRIYVPGRQRCGGLLRKPATHSTLFRGRLQERFFHIPLVIPDSANYCLAYSHSESDLTCRCSYPLEGCQIAVTGMHGLQLHLQDGQELSLEAPSAQLRDRWLESLLLVVEAAHARGEYIRQRQAERSAIAPSAHPTYTSSPVPASSSRAVTPTKHSPTTPATVAATTARTAAPAAASLTPAASYAVSPTRTAAPAAASVTPATSYAVSPTRTAAPAAASVTPATSNAVSPNRTAAPAAASITPAASNAVSPTRTDTPAAASITPAASNAVSPTRTAAPTTILASPPASTAGVNPAATGRPAAQTAGIHESSSTTGAQSYQSDGESSSSSTSKTEYDLLDGLPVMRRADVLFCDMTRTDRTIAGGLLRKRAGAGSLFSRGTLQERYFFVKLRLPSAYDNYTLDYAYTAIEAETRSRDTFALLGATVAAAPGSAREFVFTAGGRGGRSISLEADTPSLRDRWIGTLVRIIAVANLRDQILRDRLYGGGDGRSTAPLTLRVAPEKSATAATPMRAHDSSRPTYDAASSFSSAATAGPPTSSMLPVQTQKQTQAQTQPQATPLQTQPQRQVQHPQLQVQQEAPIVYSSALSPPTATPPNPITLATLENTTLSTAAASCTLFNSDGTSGSSNNNNPYSGRRLSSALNSLAKLNSKISSIRVDPAPSPALVRTPALAPAPAQARTTAPAPAPAAARVTSPAAAPTLAPAPLSLPAAVASPLPPQQPETAPAVRGYAIPKSAIRMILPAASSQSQLAALQQQTQAQSAPRTLTPIAASVPVDGSGSTIQRTEQQYSTAAPAVAVTSRATADLASAATPAAAATTVMLPRTAVKIMVPAGPALLRSTAAGSAARSGSTAEPLESTPRFRSASSAPASEVAKEQGPKSMAQLRSMFGAVPVMGRADYSSSALARSRAASTASVVEAVDTLSQPEDEAISLPRADSIASTASAAGSLVEELQRQDMPLSGVGSRAVMVKGRARPQRRKSITADESIAAPTFSVTSAADDLDFSDI